MTDVSPHPDPETLSEHADGVLDEIDAVVVTGHVEGCARCRAYLQSVAELGPVLRVGVETDPLRRQRALRAAMDAFDNDASADSRGPIAPAARWAAVSNRGWFTPRRLLVLVGVAAAAAAVLPLVVRDRTRTPSGVTDAVAIGPQTSRRPSPSAEPPSPAGVPSPVAPETAPASTAAPAPKPIASESTASESTASDSTASDSTASESTASESTASDSIVAAPDTAVNDTQVVASDSFSDDSAASRRVSGLDGVSDAQGPTTAPTAGTRGPRNRSSALAASKATVASAKRADSTTKIAAADVVSDSTGSTSSATPTPKSSKRKVKVKVTAPAGSARADSTVTTASTVAASGGAEAAITAAPLATKASPVAAPATTLAAVAVSASTAAAPSPAGASLADTTTTITPSPAPPSTVATTTTALATSIGDLGDAATIDELLDRLEARTNGPFAAAAGSSGPCAGALAQAFGAETPKTAYGRVQQVTYLVAATPSKSIAFDPSTCAPVATRAH